MRPWALLHLAETLEGIPVADLRYVGQELSRKRRREASATRNDALAVVDAAPWRSRRRWRFEVRFQEELYTAERLTGRALHARQAESTERGPEMVFAKLWLETCHSRAPEAFA